MLVRIRQFFTLAGLTAVETVRQPVCLLLATVCVLLTALVPLLLMFKFGEDGKLARDSGLAFHFVFGLFIAGYAASSSLSAEIRSGTASAVLSKPVSRELFFLAKFTGVAAVIVAFSACAALATLLAERVAEQFVFTSELCGYITDWQTGIMLACAPAAAFFVAGLLNYLKRRPFQSTAFVFLFLSLVVVLLAAGFFDRLGAFAPYHLLVPWRVAPASVLITMALIVLSAIAMTLSTRLTVIPTLVVCSMVFLAGLMSDFVFGRNAADSPAAAVFYRIVPNWQHFWISDALSGNGVIPWSYVLNAGLYGGIYLAGVLCLGLFAFRDTEMK